MTSSLYFFHIISFFLSVSKTVLNDSVAALETCRSMSCNDVIHDPIHEFRYFENRFPAATHKLVCAACVFARTCLSKSVVRGGYNVVYCYPSLMVRVPIC